MKYIVENGIYHQKDAEIGILYNDEEMKFLRNEILNNNIEDIYKTKGVFRFSYSGYNDYGADNKGFPLEIYCLKENWYEQYKIANSDVFGGYMGQFSNYYFPNKSEFQIPQVLLISPNKDLIYIYNHNLNLLWTEDYKNEKLIIQYGVLNSLSQKYDNTRGLNWVEGQLQKRTVTYFLDEDKSIKKNVEEDETEILQTLSLDNMSLMFLNSDRAAQNIIAENDRENGYLPTEVAYTISVI